MDAVMWNRGPIGGSFRLTDHQGRMRSDDEFRGKLMLLYFGYTSCPDICPTDMQQIAGALTQLGAAADEVAPLFITVDPQRDTVALLARYVPAFHPRMIGLTGSEAEIGKVASAWKVYHRKVKPAKGTFYTVDHSAFIYLVGRDGRYLGFLPPGSGAERIAGALRSALAVKAVP
jgi:protein SCO1/2